MKEMQKLTRRWNLRWLTIPMLAVTLVAGISIGTRTLVSANHPVLVEGEADFDGDGRLGTAEDTDGDDRIFGTITAALGAANGGANQNGRVTIVTSGRFHEQLIVSNANGNTTLEAAPGVEATIDAVATGARATQFTGSTNIVRQGQPGIIINAPNNRYVTLRNLVVRNWLEGILVLNQTRVTLDNVRLEGNVNYGIHVTGDSKALISHSQVSSTGFRVGATGDFPNAQTPTPGSGIVFEGSSRGLVAHTTVSGNFRYGVAAFQHSFAEARNVTAFDNDDNFYRVFRDR